MRELLVGVDVGTGSARAGVFSTRGVLLGRAERGIKMQRRSAREAEHDSEQIWSAVGEAVRDAVSRAAVKPAQIAAISFDATCSLVLRDKDGAPLSAAPDEDSGWDTLVWLDHRAIAEAAACTATHEPAVQALGGTLSPEMQIPKLMWLKRHLPRRWARLGAAYDLADFLSHRACGSAARSQSTLASKWGWNADGSGGWPAAFLDHVGLDDLLARTGLPDRPVAPGTDLGPLRAAAALALGLDTEVRVAAGGIDAHAGLIGLAGLAEDECVDGTLALIAGTSNAAMGLTRRRRDAPGLWGPYEEAVLPGTWLIEAGQSATGALLDHVVRWHAAGGPPGATLHRAITERIATLRAEQGEGFAEGIHVLPDFHGNRSPLGDAAALGAIWGLGLDADFDSLCRLYWRTALAIALATRQNVESLGRLGFATDRLLLGGGHARSPLLTELYAEAIGATVVTSTAPDVVLLGSAMMAATAAGLYPDLATAARAMAQPGVTHAAPSARRYERDYRILIEMQRQRRTLASIP